MHNAETLLDQLEEALAAGGPATGLILIHVRRIPQFAGLIGVDASRRLAQAARERAASLLRAGDQLVPFGDADFALILPRLYSPNHALLAARKILREFESPLRLDQDAYTPLVGAALATSPEHGETAEILLRRALIAYDQVQSGHQRVVVATPPGLEFWLVDDLREALAHNDLSIEFQPIVELASGRIVAAEALSRWVSARAGPVRPSQFVALAEQAGLASELTRWSINAALREFGRLRKAYPGLRCAVNLSTRVFGLSGLEEQIRGALALWDVPPSAVVLEVTETAVMEDPELSGTVLRNLRNHGLHVALDDFGQGFSSFGYLKHFPASELKIDQSYVTPIPRDPRSRQIVRAMVGLAHELEMRAVAEGVEDAATLSALADFGCDLAQGFHIGRPQTVEAWLAQRP
jgi:EAL domain-containing protein (putative c-di-GMP-specific phosphodiesterase class I)/GGDEF domain-containing protein